jgi:NADH-quinone oxidoreductase subunit J
MITLAASALDVLTSVISVIAGIGALLGAIGVITATRAFRAIMGLLVVIVCLSIEYVVLAAPVIAFIQILVYAGAVVVLFLFVVMLLELGKAGPEAAGRGPVSWVWAGGTAAGLFTICVSGIYYLAKLPGPAESASDVLAPGPAQDVGNAIFIDYLVSFEAAAVFLLAAVIAAIYIAHPRVAGEKAEPGEVEPATDVEDADPGSTDEARDVAFATAGKDRT